MSQDGAFLFDQRRFWGDSRVRKMSGEQIALYLKLLSLQWENGDLPTDPDDLACEATEGRRVYTAESLTAGKPTLSSVEGGLMVGLQGCFEGVPGDLSRMRNSFMHETRETWRKLQKARSEGGRRGGKKSRKPKKQKNLQAHYKPTLSSPVSPTQAQGKPNVTKVKEGKGREEKEEEKKAAPENGKPKRKARVNDLSYPAELLRIVPNFQKLWLKSRKIRRLGSKTTISAEQKQIDKLATWATKYGADEVRAEIDRANTACWQSVCYKEPNQGNHRPNTRRRGQAGAQPEDQQKLLDEQYTFRQGEESPEWIE